MLTRGAQGFDLVSEIVEHMIARAGFDHEHGMALAPACGGSDPAGTLLRIS